MKQPSKNAIRLFAAGYAALMLYLLIFRANPFASIQLPRPDMNLLPFQTMRRYFICLTPPYVAKNVRWAIINCFGNILLFLPLGLLPPVLWQRMRKFWKTILLAIAVMTVIELLQMVLRVGVCDVDDLILNTLGAAVGYCIYLRSHRSDTQS